MNLTDKKAQAKAKRLFKRNFFMEALKREDAIEADKLRKVGVRRKAKLP